MKKKRAFEIFMSGVVVFDILGSAWDHLPVWQFFPMWGAMILEIEVGARAFAWLSKRLHLAGLRWPLRHSSKLIPGDQTK